MRREAFRIEVEDSALEDLARRLRRTRWVAMPGDGWELGTSADYLRELLSYWRDEYDWRRHEARLNAMPQYTANVDHARIHFVHEPGHGASAMPLLLLHGWPDSFYRYHKVLPMLAGARDDAFDVVVPSLPGFAFTGPVAHPSARQPNRQSAELLWRLMTDVLGYERFAIAGGDGGSVLAQIIAIDHPDSVIGIHLTDLGWHAMNVDPASVSGKERAYLEGGKTRFMADGAYAMVQGTRPNSLAPALTDSPSALASWVLDRFHSWCDCDGDIEQSFSRDDLLTNLMIYWVTRTIGSSMRSYYDDMTSPSLTPADRVGVPVGLALFPKDIGGIPPRQFADRTLNVQRWTEMPRGGHFAALEEPDLYANDVASFFRELRAPHHSAKGGVHASAEL